MSEVVEKNITSIGKVERVDFVNQTQHKQDNNDGAEEKPDDNKPDTANELTAEKKAENIAAGLNEDGTAKTIEITAEKKAENVAAGLNEDGTPKAKAVTELTDDEIKELYEKKFPKTTELTPEQKKAEEDAKDKQRLDWFVAHGGTVDSYAAMKVVATSDLTLLSEQELEKELKEQGFTEEEKKIIRAERYFQLDDEAIESLEDENEKAFAKKKKDFGTKKLSTKAEAKQKLAVGFFENIDKAIKAAADEAAADTANEVELAQKVDSHFQTVPGKITLQMGKTAEDADIAPLELDVPAEIIAEVKDLLKTTDKRNKILFNQDNSINITALSEILIRNKVLEAAANRSYLKGVSDNTAEFEKTFPIRDRNAIGLGQLSASSNNGKVKGKIASFGKTERVNAGGSAI